MGILEILLVSIGLAMDAFAISVCKGVSFKKMNWKKALVIGLYFSIFQALMPVIGYFLGTSFQTIITKIDHWVGFVILTCIGINMLLTKDTEEHNDKIDFKTMFVLAIATSIDALAIGITFAFLNVNLLLSTSIIGTVTFITCVIGVKIGNKFGEQYERKAECVGGFILIFMGIKVLLEHLGII